jgi:hypothetical protein
MLMLTQDEHHEDLVESYRGASLEQEQRRVRELPSEQHSQTRRIPQLSPLPPLRQPANSLTRALMLLLLREQEAEAEAEAEASLSSQ